MSQWYKWDKTKQKMQEIYSQMYFELWIRHRNIKTHFEIQHNIKVYKCKFLKCNLWVFGNWRTVAEKLLTNNSFYKYLLGTYNGPDIILDS